MAFFVSGEGPRGPRRGAKGSCGTPGTTPWVSSPERREPPSGTGSEPRAEADGQPRPAKRARAAVQRGESAAQARRGDDRRGLNARDDAGWEAQLAKLKDYTREHGDCSVPPRWADVRGPAARHLGQAPAAG